MGWFPENEDIKKLSPDLEDFLFHLHHIYCQLFTNPRDVLDMLAVSCILRIAKSNTLGHSSLSRFACERKRGNRWDRWGNPEMVGVREHITLRVVRKIHPNRNTRFIYNLHGETTEYCPRPGHFGIKFEEILAGAKINFSASSSKLTCQIGMLGN